MPVTPRSVYGSPSRDRLGSSPLAIAARGSYPSVASFGLAGRSSSPVPNDLNDLAGSSTVLVLKELSETASGSHPYSLNAVGVERTGKPSSVSSGGASGGIPVRVRNIARPGLNQKKIALIAVGSVILALLISALVTVLVIGFNERTTATWAALLSPGAPTLSASRSPSSLAASASQSPPTISAVPSSTFVDLSPSPSASWIPSPSSSPADMSPSPSVSALASVSTSPSVSPRASSAGASCIENAPFAGGAVGSSSSSSAADDANPCVASRCVNGTLQVVPAPRGVLVSCTAAGECICDGRGGRVQCVSSADCSSAPRNISSDACVLGKQCTGEGVCAYSFHDPGYVLPVQTPGDCFERVCGVGGQARDVPDDNDVGDTSKDRAPCVNGVVCDKGFRKLVFKPVGTMCSVSMAPSPSPSASPSASGAAAASDPGSMSARDVTSPFAPPSLQCNAFGDCVSCILDTHCMSANASLISPCAVPRCADFVCVLDFLPAGFAPIDQQVPGDCRDSVCDAAGNLVFRNNDLDLPKTQGNCSRSTCNNGAVEIQFLPAGTLVNLTGNWCNQLICTENGSSAFVPDDTLLPPAQPCKTNICSAGVLRTELLPNGTLLPNQISNDCKRLVCSATGEVINEEDPTDLPPPRACLVGSCLGSTLVYEPSTAIECSPSPSPSATESPSPSDTSMQPSPAIDPSPDPSPSASPSSASN